MPKFILDFPVFPLMCLPSIIIQVLAIQLGIGMYKGKPTYDQRPKIIIALVLADILLFVCMWLMVPYRVPVEFPATGSVMRYELANGLSDEPAVIQVAADDTDTAEKYSFAVTFRDVKSGAPVLQTYVKSGQGAKIFVPPGDFSVVVEKGLIWFGPDRMFGPAGEHLAAPHSITVVPHGESVLQIAETWPHTAGAEHR